MNFFLIAYFQSFRKKFGPTFEIVKLEQLWLSKSRLKFELLKRM